MDILDRQEYVGDTVNFRYFRQSFKLKKRLEKPQDEWKVFPNTHPAIVDQETFALVQNLRQHRRRPNRTGIVSMFSGLLYAKIPELETMLHSASDKANDLQKFIDRAKRITRLTELTPEIVHEFIEKIVVSKPEKVDGKRHQRVDIYYNTIGLWCAPEPEEMERLFQEYLAGKSTRRRSPCATTLLPDKISY